MPGIFTLVNADTTKKTTNEALEFLRLKEEARVDKSLEKWVPWVGEKIKEAASEGQSIIAITVNPWFLGKGENSLGLLMRTRLQDILVSEGYKVVWEGCKFAISW